MGVHHKLVSPLTVVIISSIFYVLGVGNSGDTRKISTGIHVSTALVSQPVIIKALVCSKWYKQEVLCSIYRGSNAVT